MQHTSAVGSSTHARVRNPHHVAYTLLQKLSRDWQHAPFRHSWPSQRSCILQHQDRILVYLQMIVVAARCQIVVVVKHNCRTSVFEQVRLRCSRFDDSAIWCEVAVENCGTSRRGDWM